MTSAPARWSIRTVDAVGAAVVIAALVATYCLAVLPAQGVERGLSQSRLERQQARARMGELESQLAALQQQTQRLADAAAERRAAAPRVDRLNPILSEIVNASQRLGLTVQSIAPREMKTRGRRVVSTIELTALGEPRAFVALLDELARRHPYHAVAGFTMTGGGEGPCQFGLELELHMLPARVPSEGEAMK